MDHGRFDDLARAVVGGEGARRSLLRLLAGGALGGVAARLGLAELVVAKSKRKQKRKGKANARHEEALQSEGKKKGKGKKKKRKSGPKKSCSDLAPLCAPCHEPRCDTATGEYVCHNTCRDGFSCCNGLCEPPCDNGCAMNPANACACETPSGEGQVYCAAENLCAANPCKPGQTYDATTCSCKDASPQQCGPGWEWCNGACRDADYGPWTTCGNTCCRADSECCNGRCMLKQFGPFTPCGDTCCPDKTASCCNGMCLLNEMGPWSPCGGGCCRSDYEQCCGGKFCCYKESVCCGTRCCPNGYTCCGDSCCRP